MKKMLVPTIAILLVVFAAGCVTDGSYYGGGYYGPSYFPTNGMVQGGVTGAAIGGLVGMAGNDRHIGRDAATGAIIGTAIGAIAEMASSPQPQQVIVNGSASYSGGRYDEAAQQGYYEGLEQGRQEREWRIREAERQRGYTQGRSGW